MKKSMLLLAAFGVAGAMQADVTLPGILSDNMVLQRDVPVRIWGRADGGEKIKVEFNGQSAETVAAKGAWEIQLKPMPAGGPFVLKVTGKNQLTRKNVMVGEVWICSGQSNMEWTLRNSVNAAKFIKEGNLPKLRLYFGSIYRGASSPQREIPGRTWQVCTPGNCGNFSAAGFFFGRALVRALDVPVGMIGVYWGGTRIEPWTGRNGFLTEPRLANFARDLEAIEPGTPSYQKSAGQMVVDTEKWLAEAKTAITNGEPLPAQPTPPGQLGNVSHGSPARLYNSMIVPLEKFAVRGALWYQGCANMGEGMLYRDKMRALVASWRNLFKNPDMPFYFVQLAPYRHGNPGALPELWEAQQAFADGDKNVGMAVINDIGNPRDIHPRDKFEVGERLAVLALKRNYGKTDLVADSPFYASHEMRDGKAVVTFRNAKKLITLDGKPVKDFELADEAGNFFPASAAIDGNKVTVSHPSIKNPTMVRYAWKQDVAGTLANEARLPAGAFRAGKIPGVDALLPKFVPESKEWKTLYVINPAQAFAGQTPAYALDRSAELKTPAKRVAYFAVQGDKWVWVEMDAFSDNSADFGLPVKNRACIVKNLTVKSNASGVKTGTFEDGNIEFFSTNYGPENAAQIPGASSAVYDFGDVPHGSGFGFGSMQVHNYREKQTVFAFNNHRKPDYDFGLGSRPSDAPDWTFAGHQAVRTGIVVLVK